MKAILKYWKAILAVILLAVAAFVYFEIYETEKAAHEAETQQLRTMITALENRINEDKKYADIQDQLEPAMAELRGSRVDLYSHFPLDMKEEDQIMYVLYLETVFKDEIFFPFSDPQLAYSLRDGSGLGYLVMQVNYETTYDGFQDMIEYLARDSRIVSVYEATIDYDAKKDVAKGYLTLMLYMVNPNGYDELQYLPPDVAIPETGKDNIFD